MRKISNFRFKPKLNSFSTMSSVEINQKSKEYTFFSWSAQSLVNPIAMSKAKGCNFWDIEGKKYYFSYNSLKTLKIGILT